MHPLAARFFAQSEVAISHDGGDFAADTKPEQVIVVGHPTLHRDVMALLADPDIEVIGISRTETFTGQPDKRGSRVNANGQPTDTWLKICEAAGDVGAETVRQALTEDEFGFTGLHVAAAVCDTLGVGDTLVLGSSNPVRDASFVGMPFDGVSTYAARGAAGIDGTVSQAVGVALATQALRPDLKKDIKMAESERFELSIQVSPYTRFPGVPLQPLGQLSTMLYYQKLFSFVALPRDCRLQRYISYHPICLLSTPFFLFFQKKISADFSAETLCIAYQMKRPARPAESRETRIPESSM